MQRSRPLDPSLIALVGLVDEARNFGIVDVVDVDDGETRLNTAR